VKDPSLLSESRSLVGKVAAVTGASSGIGAATTLALAAAGADVVVHARQNQAGAAAIAAQAHQLGVQTLTLMADLGAPAEQDLLLEQAWQWQGKIDIWVNNAGADVLTGHAASWTFEEKFAEVWRVDVVGTMRLARGVGQRMQQLSDRLDRSIINIGWDQAAHGMGGDSGEMFAASKGAIMAFSRSLAQSLAPAVRVNCVAPGWIRTAWGQDASTDWQQRAQAESLVARWGTPTDVAQAIAFLASPAAAFINGQVLPVNGGFRYGRPATSQGA
jgi:3-oxoacyl-[acyl-carrier protein] reductase